MANVSEYFPKSARTNSKPQMENFGSRNMPQQHQRQFQEQEPPQNVNRPIKLMTVTRQPINHVPGRSVQKPTMQFHGISNSDAISVKSIPMNNSSHDSGIQKMETNQNENHRQLTEMEKVRFLTGTIDKVMKWHRIMKEFCHYEVIGPVVSIQEGTMKLQKVILMRDKKGPVLKVVHYTSDRIDLPNFHIGQIVRCVGRMISSNTLQAVLITQATTPQISALPRLSAKCDQEIAYYQRISRDK